MPQFLLALALAIGLALPAGVLPARAGPESVMIQIDNPTPGEQSTAPGFVAGWAVDTLATGGTGIDQVAIYMDGDMNGGTFLGLAEYGGDRPDVAAVLGNPAYRYSGFSLSLADRTIPPGPHTFTVVAHSVLSGNALASVANVTFAPPAQSQVTVQIDNPTPGEQNMSPNWISGWAVDRAAVSGTGIDRVQVYIDGDMATGRLLGTATYGLERPDVAAVLGNPAYTRSGFQLNLDAISVPAGPHTFTVVAHSVVSGFASASVSGVTVAPSGVPGLTPPPPPSSSTPPPPPAAAGQLQVNATLSNVSFLLGQNYASALQSFNGFLFPGLALPNGTVVNGTTAQNGQFYYSGTMTPILPFLSGPASSNLAYSNGAYTYNTALPGGAVVPYGTPVSFWNSFNWSTLNAAPAPTTPSVNSIVYQPSGGGYRLSVALPAIQPAPNASWANYVWSGNSAVEATLVVRVTLNGQPVPGAQVTFQGYPLPATDANGVSSATVLFPVDPTRPLQGTVTATYNGASTSIPITVEYVRPS